MCEERHTLPMLIGRTVATAECGTDRHGDDFLELTFDDGSKLVARGAGPAGDMRVNVTKH